MNGSTILIQGTDACREIRSAARAEVAAALGELAHPIKTISDILTDQRGILTLARCADLLGVDKRTVTETYVKKRGLPCIRLARNTAPVFLLEDVVCWLRENDLSCSA